MAKVLILKKAQQHNSKIVVSVAGHPSYGWVLVYRGAVPEALDALEAAVMSLRDQNVEPEISPEATPA